MAAGEWIGSFALTEPDAGSDAGALQTRAERKGDEWVLNGRKTFITNAPKAHHFLVFARSDKGISAFIVDRETPGVRIGQVFDTIGHSGSQPAEVVIEDCAHPADALVGEEGKGFDYAKRDALRRPYDARRALRRRRAEGDGARARVRASSARRSASRSPIIRRCLPPGADERAHRSGAPGVYRSAWLLDQGKPAIRESSTAKLLGGEWSWQTVDDAVQIFGGNGYIRGEYMIERIWRDLRVARVYDGSSEVQQIVIAQQLRKGDLQTAW